MENKPRKRRYLSYALLAALLAGDGYFIAKSWPIVSNRIMSFIEEGSCTTVLPGYVIVYDYGRTKFIHLDSTTGEQIRSMEVFHMKKILMEIIKSIFIQKKQNMMRQ